MTHTGIFVTPDELEGVRINQRTSGMFLSGGMPIGDPQAAVARLEKKYNPPANSGLDLSTGEWVTP
jgi:hypothetical protein